MKITNLKINAFGPFKGLEEIDFEKLNEKGIFLLTGKTGSGKTSIFDAICFVLYGEVSSSNGSFEKIRSDYATLDDLTYVSMEFKVKGVSYKIKRSPNQKINGRGGVVNHLHEAELLYDSTAISGVKEVNNKIVEILGLNASQFKQIVMIPQGEFMKLLLASSENKVAIFRKIFQTEKALNVEDCLSNMAKEASTSVYEIKTQMALEFKNAGITEDTSVTNNLIKLDELINNEDNNIANLKDDYNTSEIKLNDMIINYEALKKKNDSILIYEEALKNINKLNLSTKEYEYKKRLTLGYQKAKMMLILEKEINGLVESNDQIQARIKGYENDQMEKNNDLLDLELKLSFLKEKEIGIESLKKELIIKSDQIGKYNDQLAYKTQIEKLDALLIDENNKLDEIKESKNKVLEQIDITNSKIRDIQNNIMDKYSLLDNKSVVESNLNALKMSLRDFNSLNEIEIQMEKLESEMKIKKLDVLKLEEEKAHKNRLFFESEAGLLASKLEVGKPCPVCGSLNHPNPANQLEMGITKEDLDDVINRYNDESLLLTDIKTRLGMLQNQELKIVEILGQNDLLNYLNVNSDNISIKINEFEEELKKINDSIKDIEDSSKTILKYDNEVKNNTNLVNEINKKIEKINEYILSLNRRKDDVAKNIDNEILDNYGTLIHTIDDIKKRIDSYNDEVSLCREKINSINILNERFSSNIINSKEELNKNYDKIKEKRVIFEEALNNYDSYEEYKDSLIDDKLNVEYERYVSEYESSYSYNKKIIENNSEYIGQTIMKLDGVVSLIEERKKELNDKLLQIGSKTENNNRNKTIYNRIKELNEKSFNKIRNYELITRLANITKGSNSLKMSFEKYILAIYFEEVLICANDLLGKMTDNKYELIRRDYLSKGNAMQGLDLDVYDYSTGHIRSINTLSGGEQFKASLSLALGLSESIRRQKSIIEIDTMFIDEGFGSLDPESINQAMDVLLNIKNQGRVIGIISHVDDLKERIETKIVLEKGLNGSTIKV